MIPHVFENSLITAIRPISFDRLASSSESVRRVRPGEPAQWQPVASVRPHGAMRNLVAVPRDPKPTHRGAIASALRLATVAALVKGGETAPDMPLPCLVKQPENAAPASLTESFHRALMHPADEFRVFVRLTGEGSPSVTSPGTSVSVNRACSGSAASPSSRRGCSRSTAGAS